jgi:hypothetical protein
MRLAILPLLLLAACVPDAQIRKDANSYRVELNQIAERIDEYAATAALACQFQDQLPAIKGGCRHLVDIDDGLRVSFKAAWAVIDVAESTGIVVDDGVRVVAKARRLVDEYGDAVHVVAKEVRDVLHRRDSESGDSGGGSDSSAGKRAPPPEGGEAPTGAVVAPADGPEAKEEIK